MQPRQSLRDVAHVRGADRAPAARGRSASHQREVADVVVGEHRVLPYRGVRGLGLRDRDLGPGCERAGLETRDDPPVQVVHRGGVEGADLALDDRLGGDDVGGVSALAHEQADAASPGELLAQQPDRHLGHHSGVGGVDPQVRGGGGVGGPAGVGDGEAGDAGCGDVVRVHVLGLGVHHHRHRHVVEDPPLQQKDLAAAVLLGRGPDDGDADAELVGHLGETHPGTGGRGGDDVVPAGVAEFRQRVVLRAQADGHVPVAVPGDERGTESPDAVFHGETLVRKQRRDSMRCMVFGEGELGIGMDPVAEGQQPAADPFDASAYPVLEAVQFIGGGHAPMVTGAPRALNTARATGASSVRQTGVSSIRPWRPPTRISALSLIQWQEYGGSRQCTPEPCAAIGDP